MSLILVSLFLWLTLSPHRSLCIFFFLQVFCTSISPSCFLFIPSFIRTLYSLWLSNFFSSPSKIQLTCQVTSVGTPKLVLTRNVWFGIYNLDWLWPFLVLTNETFMVPVIGSWLGRKKHQPAIVSWLWSYWVHHLLPSEARQDCSLGLKLLPLCSKATTSQSWK